MKFSDKTTQLCAKRHTQDKRHKLIKSRPSLVWRHA